MNGFRDETRADPHAEVIAYIADMIAQLAEMARRTGEPAVAIHLEAILAARRATELARTA